MELLIILAARYLYLASILVGILAIVISSRPVRSQMIKLALISLPAALVIGKILGHFIYNPRPFVVEHIQPLIAHSASNGFPSDHTLLMMTIAAVVFVYSRKVGILLFLLALVVGIARVLAKIHYPVDIFGSSFIALMATYVAWYCLKRFKALDEFLTFLLSKVMLKNTRIV